MRSARACRGDVITSLAASSLERRGTWNASSIWRRIVGVSRRIPGGIDTGQIAALAQPPPLLGRGPASGRNVSRHDGRAPRAAFVTRRPEKPRSSRLRVAACRRSCSSIAGFCMATWIDTLSFRLLPFGQRQAMGSRSPAFRYAASPPVLQVNHAKRSSASEEGMMARCHGLRIDARPHAVRMATALLFMKTIARGWPWSSFSSIRSIVARASERHACSGGPGSTKRNWRQLVPREITSASLKASLRLSDANPRIRGC